MKLFTAVAASLILWTASAGMAGPLNPEHLPRDAKWVIHIDYDALAETAVMEQLRETRPQVVEQVRSWLQERYGIDPREDLHGVTLFSDTYESHTGAAVLFADYDLERVKSDLMSKPGVKTTEWEGHMLYTWTANEHASHERRTDRDRGDSAQGEPAAERSSPRHEGGQVTVALLEGKAVFAPTPERVQSAIKLLEGDAPSLAGGDSKLIGDVPDGAILYGAAVELQQIARREEIFPILQQHEHIRWVIGERDGRPYEEFILVAKDEEVAGQMKTALEGFVALGKVWAADSEELARLYEGVEIQQQGNTVRLDWQGEPQAVAAALTALGERFARASGRERARQ